MKNIVRFAHVGAGLSILATGAALAPAAQAVSVTAPAATSAVATSGSTNYAHFPGTFWPSKAACQSYAQGYVNKVKAAGFTSASPLATNWSRDADDQSCHVWTKGWSYVSTYDVPAGKKAFSGDLVSSSDQAKAKVDAAGYVEHTYTHDYQFTTASARDAAYKGVLAHVKSDPRVEYLYSVKQTNTSLFPAVPTTYEYVVTYNGTSDGASYPYETWRDSSLSSKSGRENHGKVDAMSKDHVTDFSIDALPSSWDLVYHIGNYLHSMNDFVG